MRIIKAKVINRKESEILLTAITQYTQMLISTQLNYST